jgi:cephalosporin hydroxylase
MSVSTQTKNNKPRAKWSEKYGLPKRTRIEAKLSPWKKLVLLFKHRRFVWDAGWQALLARGEGVIQDDEYKDRLQSTLGEYLNWYFTDKSFLHSIDWMGIPTRKLVTDVWVYQEIIFETKPDLIIEIGSFYGGSTLFLAQMLDLLGSGEVLSIDVSHDHFMPNHPRIRKITADCSDEAVVEQARELAKGKRVMVIHDGDHTAAAVERDLKLYAPLVTPDMYLIIEDGVVDLLDPRHSKVGRAYPGGGPMKAARRFLNEMEAHFELDMKRERFILTTNPKGYLRRKSSMHQDHLTSL